MELLLRGGNGAGRLGGVSSGSSENLGTCCRFKRAGIISTEPENLYSAIALLTGGSAAGICVTGKFDWNIVAGCLAKVRGAGVTPASALRSDILSPWSGAGRRASGILDIAKPASSFVSLSFVFFADIG